MNDLTFLKKSELFKGLPENKIKEIFESGELIGFGPDEYIIREGDKSYDLYVIKDGVVEVIVKEGKKVITYLSEGESFGEMALITGDKRSASIRVPEKAVVFKLPAEVYENYIYNDNLFLRRICEVLAIRLKRANTEITIGDVRKKLHGKLKYFDLPTVLQTISHSKGTGILWLENPTGKDVEMFIAEGKVVNVNYKELDPEEAFYQVFLDLDSFTEFKFDEKDKFRILSPKIYKDLSFLLMEAVKNRDEFEKLLKELGGKERKFKKISRKLLWNEESTLECATQIWIMIEENFKLKDILSGCNRSYDVVIKIIHNMLKNGLIE